MQNELKRRAIPPLVALITFCALAALYLEASWPTYRQVLGAWGVRAWPFPFLDTDTVLSAARCLREGADVYAFNPCDPEFRPYGYSPLYMLVLAHFPVTLWWIPWVGLTLFALFVWALWLLPAGRNRESVVLICIGLLSCATVLAVERGNNDLVNFALVAGMAALMGRSAIARLAGYAMGLLAGLLKFYPMLVMLSALRERPARFFAITAVSVVITIIAAAATWHDLVRAWSIVPEGSPIYEMFGAPNFGKGLVVLFGLPSGVGTAVRLIMTLAAFAIGIRYGLKPEVGAAMERLTNRERDFLLIGALMVIGCFMSAQNISYRTINLLLVLPSLTALRLVEAPRALKVMAWLAIGLLWAELLFHWIQAFAAIAGGTFGTVLEFGLGWLGREIAWWSMVTLLIACAAALIRPMAMVHFTLGLGGKR
ncbi:glycosyltransferase 87 family protein [Novosphingobium sp. MW5]|nr:glycosyltransferase 87 family protein [Novosphingobium sp. MW5]